MKHLCDVCGNDEASVYCSADEAALCHSCDYQVHRANKLASKHYRFHLLKTDEKECPFCDVCQEKRAFLFCQQDRAILCIDCDDSMHSANKHTRKHDRFLLTGVKLSVKADLYTHPSKNSLTYGCDLVPDFKSQSSIGEKDAAESQSEKSVLYEYAKSGSYGSNASDCGLSSSSISEYLMETLPGWRVEDLLDSSSALYGFTKQYENGVHLPFSDSELLGQNDLASSFVYTQTAIASSIIQSTNVKGTNSNVKFLIDDGYTVPEIISPQSSSVFKSSRLI